ncbi:MAG: MarR family transcriptional regulator [Haliea sp.]|nr:MarR family transcriptional regulator [Haliea sp.]
MSAINSINTGSEFTWNRYRHNFSRHLLGVARHLQTSLMDTLQRQCGYSDLRLGFSPYINLLGEGNKRLTDLADILGISRQACNQAIKQVEAAGYIARAADPLDGRAWQLTLSERGKKLRRDGARIVAQLDQQFADIVGSEHVADASKSLGKICQHLSLGVDSPSLKAQNAMMGGWLPRLSDYVLQRLMELTRGRGHDRLKLSFGQVLTLIGPAGGRIQQMAAAHDVSKQAISAIATELEELGYLQREADPLDARQVVLQFTARGLELIADSVASVDQLEEEFAAIIGNAALKRMNTTLYTLYCGLHLEQDIFEHRDTVDLSLLARQIQQQLGHQDSRALARLLLNPSQNTR